MTEAIESFRRTGAEGGKKRAASLKPAERKASAKRAAWARWNLRMTIAGLMRRFRASAAGQETIEYSILLGFLFLVFACLFFSETPSVRNIWKSANVTLNNAAPAVKAAEGRWDGRPGTTH